MSTVLASNALLVLLVVALNRPVRGVDVFCGSLTIYEQQRFGLNSVALSSQETSDLKQCLELCCSVLNCRGVTFTGVIVPHKGEPNCLLVGCRDRCEMNERAEYTDGLLSVLINRTEATPATSSTLSEHITSTSTGSPRTDRPSSSSSSSPHAHPHTSTMASSTSTQTSSSVAKANGSSTMINIVTGSLAPVWAVGLAIVIAVVCVGLNLGLLSAYICYRRQRSRKQTAQITVNKGPTLHAYNPTIGLR